MRICSCEEIDVIFAILTRTTGGNSPTEDPPAKDFEGILLDTRGEDRLLGEIAVRKNFRNFAKAYFFTTLKKVKENFLDRYLGSNRVMGGAFTPAIRKIQIRNPKPYPHLKTRTRNRDR